MLLKGADRFVQNLYKFIYLLFKYLLECMSIGGSHLSKAGILDGLLVKDHCTPFLKFGVGGGQILFCSVCLSYYLLFFFFCFLYLIFRSIYNSCCLNLSSSLSVLYDVLSLFCGISDNFLCLLLTDATQQLCSTGCFVLILDGGISGCDGNLFFLSGLCCITPCLLKFFILCYDTF